MRLQDTVQQLLEAVGLVESPARQVRRKLALLSQAQQPGRVTVIVTGVEGRENSAISALRQVTDLPLREVLAYLRILPAPLLTNVSPQVAEATAALLRKRGVQVRLVGLEEAQPAAVQPAAQPAPAAAPANRMAAASPARRAPRAFAVRPGDYVVTLTTVGLLGERVLDGVRRLTGEAYADVRALEAALPLRLLDGVDQDTAVRAQIALQMIGAVVDIDERPSATVVEQPPSMPEPPAGLQPPAEPKPLFEPEPPVQPESPLRYGLRLALVGNNWA
ncbi:MAG: hypothetical protein KC425_27335, partial [Anaerolineales bacterium]|nr:hypothetical protein [Anaerolineales bacterium]